ncbi:MAG: hypothetical protein HKP09_05430 [Enterobacterales bacterium]|nr:hypothetical protein [Enterobacterales bacterium]
MTDYLLGIDAGGTKTKARLVSVATGEQWQFRDGPASLTNDRPGAIKRVIAVSNELIGRAAIKPQQVSMVCGIAGANHEVARLKLQDKVAELGLAKFSVISDSIISVYGAGYGKPMLCVAVGTGSVAVLLNGAGDTQQFGGWGFTAGDQGSGADLGRKLVRGGLDRFDAGDYLDDPLYRALFDEIGQSSEEIMAWLNSAKVTDYARLMHVLQRFPEHERVKELLAYAGKATSRLIEIGLAHESVPVALMGGMANYISDYIAKDFRSALVEPEGDALDGALWLAAQNLKQVAQDD